MVVLWYGSIATCIGSAVGAVCSWLWYRTDGGNEAFYGATSTTIVAVLSLIGIVVQYFFDTPANEESDAGPARDTASSLLAWLLRHVPSKNLSKTLPKALRLTKLLGDKDFEHWILCEMKGYSPSTMTATEMVPEYRTVTGRHMDTYGRALILEDPSLSFVNEDRLRLGVRELEAHANNSGMLYIQNTESIRILKEHLGVDVIQFAFSRASIHGILDSIRSEMLDRLHKMEQTLASENVEPQADKRKCHRKQQPDCNVGKQVGDALTDIEPDAIELQLMELLTERSYLTPGRAASLIGCKAAVAEHRLQRLSRAGLVRSDSFGADGADFHLTFEGRDWLHRHGHLD